jgi:3-oxoacyl-[acyl-carrier protein] reductase
MEKHKGAIIVTGAGQGLGLAFARRLASDGRNLVLTDVLADEVEAATNELSGQGVEAMGMAADVTDPEAMAGVVDAARDRFGELWGLVNNASIFSTLRMRPFDEISLEEWRRVIDVNLTGVFVCCQAVAPALKAANCGRIVNISSAVVSMGRPNYMHYVASKAGVVGMTRAMARELGDWNITVNAVLPGATDTGIPRETVSAEQRAALIGSRALKRAQVPEDLTGVVAFLIGEESRFVTGQSLIVDGGTVFS